MAEGSKAALSTKQNIVQFVKFTLFSASAGLIQAVSFTLMFEFAHLSYWFCYLVALILSIIYNFTVNRRFTFKSTANIPIAMLKVFGYYAVFTPLSTWGGYYLTEIGINEYLVLAVSMIANFVTEYLFTRFVVYRNTINTMVDKGVPTQLHG
ncbi:MAG: GtrA family protein [Saccharofermentanales bacterium]